MYTKNIITGEKMIQGSLGDDWQEFASKRRDKLEEALYIEKLSSEYLNSDKKLRKILSQVGNNNLIEDILDAAFAKERIANYIYYNCGFKEGLRLALKLSTL